MKKIRPVFRFLIFVLLSLIIFSLFRFIVQLFTDDNFLLILIPVTALSFFALAREYVYSLVNMMMSWTTVPPGWWSQIQFQSGIVVMQLIFTNNTSRHYHTCVVGVTSFNRILLKPQYPQLHKYIGSCEINSVLYSILSKLLVTIPTYRHGFNFCYSFLWIFRSKQIRNN